MANLNLLGTSGDDTLLGGTGSDTLNGGAGNDSLSGSSGNDSLIGGSGNDTLDGGLGNDTLSGGDGNDTLKVSAGNDIVDGGLGFDTLDASSSGTAITVNLSTGILTGPGNTTLTGIEGVVGSGLADSITGSTAAENLNGGSGNDTVSGGGGADTLYGGGGNDSITVGATSALVYGDAGNDTLIGGIGNDTIFGGTGSDNISGGDGDDRIDGGDGGDTIAGGNGNDIITSSAGADRVTGDAGLDTYVYSASISGASAQTFDGGAGVDTLEIHVTPAQLTVAAQAEIIAFQSFIANPLNAGKTFQFTAIGNLQVKNVEAMTLVVDVPPNAAPVIDTNTTTTALNGSHAATLAGTIAATDADGNALTYGVQTGPQHGTVTFTDTNGHYTYAAANGYDGNDSFTLQVSDGQGGVATQVVNVTTTNAGPVVSAAGTDASLTVTHNATIAGAVVASDADGDQLSYALQTGPQHGTVTFTDANGHYTYTAGNSAGADSFTISVSDGHGGVATQVVNVTTTNAGPVVSAGSTDTSLTVAHNAVIAGAIAATDADGDALSYSVQTGPQHGTVTFTDANGHYVYTAGNFAGADSFTLAVADGHGGVTTQIVNVTTTNAGPVIASSGTTAALSVLHNGSVAGAIAASDANGDSLSYSLLSGPQHGTVTFTDANGHFTFTAADYAGADSFTVQVDDGHGGLATQTVTVGITGTASVAAATVAQTINLATGAGLTADQAKYTIDIVGSSFNDSLTGDARDNVLTGGAGNDTLAGGDGNDTLYGGTGTDNLSGANGNDYLDAGDGNDALNGGAGNDTLIGGNGNDGFYGGGGNDYVTGDAGNDRVFGDGGNDTIFGGLGNDTMTGGTQNGAGVAGDDTYVWTRNDVLGGTGPAGNLDHITDFGAGDKLDFSQLFNGAHPAVISTVVHVTDTAAGTVVSADLGTGFVDIVVLDGVHGATINDLDLQHAIVV